MLIERTLNPSLRLKIAKSANNSEEFSSTEVKVDPDKERQRKKQQQSFSSSNDSENECAQSLDSDSQTALSEIQPKLGRRLDLLA